MKNTVVIIEDHILFSQALTGLINGFSNFNVLYSCQSRGELFNQLRNRYNIPDIILIDIDIPAIDVIETVSILNTQYPGVSVIALSREENKRKILKILSAGARGYLPKYAEQSVLKRALEEVVQVGFFYTTEVSNLLIESLHPQKKNEVELKDREIEFVKHACTEKTYKEIARDMCLSPRTIEGYRDAIFEKLNLKNRTGMVLYAIKNDIFQL